jgi:hypothetical protein
MLDSLLCNMSHTLTCRVQECTEASVGQGQEISLVCVVTYIGKYIIMQDLCSYGVLCSVEW